MAPPSTNPYKPGSRINKVWAARAKDGAEKAFEYGLTLGLKENTLRSWLRTWDRDAGIGPKPRAERTPRASFKRGITSTLPRVRVSWWPGDECVLVLEGPDQSMVKWITSDDEFIRPGHVACIPNSQWKLIPQKKGK